MQVRVRDVRRVFDGGRIQALCGVSFSIAQGEFVAIMGPSGSGKSCLLQILGALDNPDSGDVFFQDQSLSGLTNRERFRAQSIGFIFQSFHLLPTLSALENVQIPMFEMPWASVRRLERARKLLIAVGLGERLHHLPNNLSGGERQRVAIARSLANEPKLLLADEPTGNLDSGNAEIVLALLKQVHQQNNMTLIIVTHDAEVASHADRILRLRDGLLIPTQSPEARQD